MTNNFIEVKINTNSHVLSSKSLFYKSESFIKDSRYVGGIDSLLIKLCEGIIDNIASIEKMGRNSIFSIRTADNKFVLEFMLGAGAKEGFNAEDIIFLQYTSNQNALDIKIDEYIKNHETIPVIIRATNRTIDFNKINKLYLILGVSGINLPRLSGSQKEIVETVDKNMVVQGVAGSGKTNVCIDKIIFTACKNYSKKTLYSTYSRGLLIDTKLKIEKYIEELQNILNGYKNKTIRFLDKDHRKALENRLGIFFFSDDDNDIVKKLESVIYNLTNKVDYLLIEDLYNAKFDSKEFVGQDYFISQYSTKLSNHHIEKIFSRLPYSKEIIYKEIFGMILGYFNDKNISSIMPLDQYIASRAGSISKSDCEAIYLVAEDYLKYCSVNGVIDNNIASRELLNTIDRDDFEYALTILDEVQDYTQVNLALFKYLSLKLFCVGDALQMINPSYFTFGNLKNLLYSSGVTQIKELKYNYRNSAKIEKIIDSLGEINKREFGTHNFVVTGQSVDDGVETSAVYVSAGDFVKKVAGGKLDNFTFVVATDKEKKDLAKIIKNQEILTISEIKGLERPTIVTFNILSSNEDKWRDLSRNKVNHKTADENSVYRYYYNLFYVGLTRAKQNIFVVECKSIPQFELFFKKNFDCMSTDTAIQKLTSIVKSVEFTQKDLESRVYEFIKLSQWDNAILNASKIKDDGLRIDLNRIIEVYSAYVSRGKYREAGVKLWEYGLLDEAKKMFTLSGDKALIELIDKCSNSSSKDLSVDIIDYYYDVRDNSVARDFILETINRDLNNLKTSFKSINNNLNKGKR